MRDQTPPREVGLWTLLVADGLPLLSLTGVVLLLSGVFALFHSATGHFLPHDIAYLGMQATDLCAVNECRVVHFMIHDRVSFGGTLIAIGVLYLWLTNVPLRAGERWAWRTLLASGVFGFATFLTYLGYGYLDTWHGAGTLALLPVFAIGLVQSHRIARLDTTSFAVRLKQVRESFDGSARFRRWLLLWTSAALVLGGFIIMGVGMTSVFVPQDLAFMGLDSERVHAINPRLVPLIAHDRAGFGGGVACTGLTMFLCVLLGRPSRSLWEALLLAGGIGFGTAVGVHPAIGYTSFTHLAPALLGAAMFVCGILLTYRRYRWRPNSTDLNAVET